MRSFFHLSAIVFVVSAIFAASAKAAQCDAIDAAMYKPVYPFEIQAIEEASKTMSVTDRIAKLRERLKGDCLSLTAWQEKRLNEAAALGEQEMGDYYYRRFKAQRSYTNAESLRAQAVEYWENSLGYRKYSENIRKEAAIANLSPGPVKSRAASTCGAVNLSPAFGPPRNQDSLGICFAEAAADFADFFLRQKYPGIRLSSLDAAIQYIKIGPVDPGRTRTYEVDSLNNGGDPQQVLRQMNENGVCLESDFSTRQAANQMDTQAQLYSLMSTSQEMKSAKAIKDFAAKKCEALSSLRQMLPTANLQDLSKVLSFADTEHFLYDLDQLACSGKRKAQGQIPQVISHRKTESTEMMNAIDQALTRGEPAIGTLDMKDYNQIRGPAEHAVLVVGRQWNTVTNSCDYKIRNSWGSHYPFPPPIQSDNEGNFYLPQGEIEAVFSGSYTR